MPAIDYDTIKGRIAKTKGTLSALNVAIGSYCVVLGGTIIIMSDSEIRSGVKTV